MPPIEGVQAVSNVNGAKHLTLAADVTPQEILSQLISNNAVVEQFEVATPTLDDIFVRTVGHKVDR
jgi:ABC-type uncharacterized transport system ATPase subunit